MTSADRGEMSTRVVRGREAVRTALAAPPAVLLRQWWSSRFGYRAALELVLVLGAFYAYQAARLISKDQISEAFINADRLIAAERGLGIYNEQSFQSLVLNAQWLVDFLNEYYVEVHFVITPLVLIWLYVMRPEGYDKVRRIIIGSMILALIGHLAFPLAPPWMLPSEGFVDTLAVYGQDIHNNGNPAVNRVAAMPSLHFGWAALVAAAIVMNRRSRLAWIAVAHPVITLVAIVATGNHYWADAIVGGGIVALLYAFDTVWENARSERRAAINGPPWATGT